MMLRIALHVLLIGAVTSGVAFAFELATHARITEAAATSSVLTTDAIVLPNLGIPSHKYTFLGEAYIDSRGPSNRVRQAQSYDFNRNKMRGVEGQGGDERVPFRVTGWLMRGAVREDDGDRFAGVTYPWLAGEQEQPYDDP